MVFARKTTVVVPDVRVTEPTGDLSLRDEVDPDPLIEEMVGRLREGLSNLDAMDEWGRPLAWRNVVRLALGPLASRLRDTEQALELAVSMLPENAEEQPAPEQPALHVVEAVEAAVEEPAVEEPVAEEAAAEPTVATVEVLLPLADARPEEPVQELSDDVVAHAILKEAPIEVPAEVKTQEQLEEEEFERELAAEIAAGEAVKAQAEVTASASAVPVMGAASPFPVSGDQRAVAVGAVSPTELVSGSSADDSTAAKYDRFLTGLYGERQQVGGDEDRGAGGAGLRNNL